MAAKAVIRDVGRVLGHPFGLLTAFQSGLPDPGMTLEKAFKAEPALPELYEADEEVKELIDMCRILEGCTRNAGKHAGGVISPTPLLISRRFMLTRKVTSVTQFDKNDRNYWSGQVYS